MFSRRALDSNPTQFTVVLVNEAFLWYCNGSMTPRFSAIHALHQQKIKRRINDVMDGSREK